MEFMFVKQNNCANTLKKEVVSKQTFVFLKQPKYSKFLHHINLKDFNSFQFYRLGGKITLSITCTIPFDAFTEAIIVASLICTLPSLTVIFALPPFTMPNV